MGGPGLYTLITGASSGSIIMTLTIATTARNYIKQDQYLTSVAGTGTTPTNNYYQNICTTCDMTAGDVATFSVQLTPVGVAATYNLYGNGTTDVRTFVSGRFIG